MEKKKTYVSPQLKSYGSVQDLTEDTAKFFQKSDGHTMDQQSIGS